MESIAEEEEQDKLYQELDGLLEGVDFAEPLTPEYISSYTDENKTTEETSSVHISSPEVSKTSLKTSLNIFLIKTYFYYKTNSCFSKKQVEMESTKSTYYRRKN